MKIYSGNITPVRKGRIGGKALDPEIEKKLYEFGTDAITRSYYIGRLPKDQVQLARNVARRINNQNKPLMQRVSEWFKAQMPKRTEKPLPTMPPNAFSDDARTELENMRP